ncbi:hypothetical protein [Spiroplasma endosymbiont of Polydrusus cervinus]|uniref:hypothetical protein n=1 Tax=Spiroplasma endosymbiont of Polydrusus cervinus TaxID=3066287 RepID=UPI0030D5FCBB
MKKLLSLLSILTISGTGVRIMIADIPYQKNTIKDLSELNWTGLNINKNKRDTKNNQTKHIFKTNGADRPTEKQIKNKVKELNPQLNVNNINVTKITENSAVITLTGFSNTKTINFIIDKSVDLNTIIPNNTSLGQIIDNEEGKQNIVNISEIQIKDKLKKLFPSLNISKINIKLLSTHSSKITSNDINVYIGETDVKYTLPLGFYIKNNNLGVIKTNGLSIPTDNQIKDKIKELYPIMLKSSFLNFLNINIINSTNAKISCRPNNDTVSDILDINFTVDKSVLLSTVINNNTLDEFKTNNLSNPTAQQIKNKVKGLNPRVDIDKIKVENINNNKATINSSDLTVYIGNIDVNYSISIDSLNW